MAKLKKVLSFKVILLIVINSIMGTGIYFLPALGAKTAGPASLIAWGVLSIFCIYIAMCFAELTSMFPNAGGVYEFCKQAYGRFGSFIIGWTTFVAGNLTIAMLIVGAIRYLLPLGSNATKIAICLIFVFVFNYIAYKGMDTSAFMLVTFACITLGTVFTIILFAIFKFDSSNLTPFVVTPISSIFLTLFLIAETYFGWESATFLAGETKDGAKVMPRALIIGTIIMTIIGFSLTFFSLGAMNWEEFGNAEAPLVSLGAVLFGEGSVSIITILVYLAIIGAVAGWIISAPRLILSMAKDKLFPTQFAAIHPKRKTPYKAILFQTIVISILVFFAAGSYQTLLHLLLPTLTFMYSAVLISLIILRKKKPNHPRYFKVPYPKIGISITIMFIGFLLVMWLIHTPHAINSFLIVISFMLLGLPLYFLIEMYYDPKVIVKVNDFFAYITLLTEKVFLPVSVRKEIISLLGDIHKKKVLEYGCSVGSLTIHLADAVSPKGMVYATDTSVHELNITVRRIKKKGHRHVKVYQHLVDSVHPKIPKIDAVVSVGMIGYLQKVEHVLKELNKRLDKGSKLCFVDFDKFFDVIPNIEWLSDDKKIIRAFGKCGFEVTVIRKQGFAWQYIYIYGIKVRNVK